MGGVAKDRAIEGQKGSLAQVVPAEKCVLLGAKAWVALKDQFLLKKYREKNPKNGVPSSQKKHFLGVFLAPRSRKIVAPV